jgi:hypothetical protein
MVLYLKLALVTAIPFGLFMAAASGAFDSVGDFVETAALYGVPFGVLFSLIVGTLHYVGDARVRARSTLGRERKGG